MVDRRRLSIARSISMGTTRSSLNSNDGARDTVGDDVENRTVFVSGNDISSCRSLGNLSTSDEGMLSGDIIV